MKSFLEWSNDYLDKLTNDLPWWWDEADSPAMDMWNYVVGELKDENDKLKDENQELKNMLKTQSRL